MESFGGAVCRESVFASNYEPQVAIYLRDRQSRALTIHRGDSVEPIEINPKNINVYQNVPQSSVRLFVRADLRFDYPKRGN